MLEEKKQLIEPDNSEIPIHRQCELLDLARASYYYKPIEVSPYNDLLMKLIDEQYTRTPFYGSVKMTVWLKEQGHHVNHKRVARLMRLMGIQAVHPKPRLSIKNSEHKIYPYLLEGMEITRRNQVWSTDITYIRLRQGFIYLVAIIDWYSRYVLSWSVSNTMDVTFCIEALQNALKIDQPEIFNSDQGSQFTSHAFTQILLDRDIKISMDGKGRCFDNIFCERLWRSVKYEEVYLKEYRNMLEAIEGLRNYFKFYNHERFHQSLGYKTPEKVYFDRTDKNNFEREIQMVQDHTLKI